MNTEPELDRPTPLAPIHVVVPMRTISGGKARLGEALDAEEREELVLGLLLNTLMVLGQWPACRRIHLVSPDPAIDVASRLVGVDVSLHRQPGTGLNPAVFQGVRAALIAGARTVLVLPGDLPHVSVDALEHLIYAADAGVAAAAGGGLVAIVPSDARSGTNALLLRPPDIIAPAFGLDSFEAHLRAAAEADAAVQVVNDEVLGFDLDTPDDLERLDPARLRQLMTLGREATDTVEA